MVKSICVKFNYDPFHTDKALGNFRKYENNKHKNKLQEQEEQCL